MAGSILYTITQPISVFGDDPMNSAERDLFMQKLRKLALQCRESPDASLVFSAVKPTYVTIVEFPLHTTFPSYYHLAETEYKGNRILLYLESFMKRLDTPAEKKDYNMKTNTIVAALISNDPVYRSSGIDHDIYDFLEESSNDLIRSYKLVPQRHNHDLEPITNTRVSPVSPILHFDVTEELVEGQGGTALMTSFNSIANNLSNQKDVAKEYMPYMSHEGLVSTIDARYVEPMYRLVRSRDLNCIGDYGLSIILSASAGEGLLAALEYEIRVHALGENSQDVEAAIGTEYLGDFKKFAKDNYALSTGNSSKYKKWYKSSYLLRNNFIHKQAVPQGPQQSNAAIQSTIDLMIEAVDLIIGKYEFGYLSHIKEIALGISNDHPAGSDSTMTLK